ncbi:calcium-binding protein [Conexibacter arvalis]|uniref:Calcium-binding protein n=1 Tax=Conexibacter arvalis TaxID=912552 RepID=A0A840ILH2_9ACTN|nr:calcium-binding protein [Conexibacter arvalis]MBB4664750.1 hypothetical protein [Conexibacter arvalis]
MLCSRSLARRGGRAAALAAALLMLAGVGAAQAATIDHDGTTLTIAGTPGVDDLLLSHGGGGSVDPAIVEVKSWNGSTLTPGAAAVCTAGIEADLWACPRPQRIVATLGDGDDLVTVYEDIEAPFTVPVEIDAGAGNDRIDGTSGNDVIHGGPGDDQLTGRDGDDRIHGQDGNDILNGDFGSSGPGGDDHLDGGAGDDQFEQYVGFGYPASLKGNDTYIGGPGNDSFSYFHRADPVTITLDGIADDGMAGEADNIHPDIETVGGSAGDDVIVGSPGDDILWGGDGDDRISGLGGNDRISGDDGDDVVDGGPGDDELTGGCMTDTLIGGPGADTFYSDAGPTSTCGFSLRSPFDRIEAADGEADTLIFCQVLGDQAGDVAIVDAVDPVATSGPGACGTVSVVAPPGGGGGSGGGGGGGGGGAGTVPAPGGAKLPTGKVRMRLGAVRLLVGNGRRGAAVKQQVELKRKRLTLGTLVASRKTRVTVTASIGKGRKAIALGRRTVTVPAGRAAVVRLALPPRARTALRRARRATVAVSLRVGKKTVRKSFGVVVARR